MKSIWIKLIAIGACLAVLLAAWGYDAVRAKKYDVELVYLSNPTPYAVSTDTVDFTIQVRRGEEVCVGHELYIQVSGGKLNAYLSLTDENGKADFTYYPYNETKRLKAGKVTFVVKDLSNSLLVEVNAVMEFSIVLKSPSEEA